MPIMRHTLSEIASALGLDPSGLRTLRHLASSGVLQAAGTVDARGTQAYETEEVFRAAVAMALTRMNLTVGIIAAAMAEAEQMSFKLRDAVSETFEGRPCEFRMLSWPENKHHAEFAPVGFSTAPDGAESILRVNLDVVWAPIFAAAIASRRS